MGYESNPRRFLKQQRCSISNSRAKVWAKHANCSVFVCTDVHWTLFRVPASEETRAEDLLIYLLYIMLLPHRSNISIQFLSQLFTFTDITDWYCNLCVFNINMCVFHSLSAIKHERELSVVTLLTCHVTCFLCVCASDVCVQKTKYHKFKLILV